MGEVTRSNRWLMLLAGPPAILAAAFVIGVPLDARGQWIFAICAVAITWILHRASDSRRATLVLAVFALLVSTRYIVWRTTHTLEFDSVASAFFGIGLYLAEIYAWIIMALGFLQTSWPMQRKVVEPVGAPEEWPTVDVYIPTYNESLEIVRNTVFAAMDMDYPADRFNVYILDDGRRPEFRAFAREAGCGYLTRDNNLHAKAGNLNAAMGKTDGDLIAVFDCDHVPTRAFLQMTIGWFQREDNLALLQTPHHFYSPDPVQRNLRSFGDMPGEGDLFYGPVQAGNDLWNATFFCGSCAVIRRKALEQTNGFAGETVTEDAHTALKLQRMGWDTAYIGARLSAGLATERLVLHIGQRVRWARGMTQILRIDTPLLGRGLKLPQRLCYLNAMLHFQFPLPRIVFLTSPLAYLIAGQNIIHASAGLIFAYALPHLFISMISSERIQGAYRRPFWGEIYESILAFHLVKPTVLTLFQPRKGKFNVTDKGGLLDRTYFDMTTVQPHLAVIGLLIFGLIFGWAKLFLYPEAFSASADTMFLNTVWAGFSLMILLAAVSVARERRQIREHIRIEAELPVTLYFDDGYVINCETADFSMSGLAARLPGDFCLNGRDVTDVSMPMGDETLTIPVETVRTENRIARVRFRELTAVQARHLVRAVMGRSDAWQPAGPRPPVPTLRALRDVAAIDLTTLGMLVSPASRRLLAVAVTLTAAALLVFALGSGRAFGAPVAPDAPRAETAEEIAPLTAGEGMVRRRVTLRDLQVRTPIRLMGTRGEIGIPFGVRQDEVVTDAALTLDFAYSPALLEQTSQLVVMLNGEVVETLALPQETADGVTVQIPVEPALFLPGDNSLNLRFLGHYALDCEDPFHSSLWANISNVRSYMDLTVQRLPLPPDLARLPAPFFDADDSLPLDLPFVFAGPPTEHELEAAAAMASWFGGLAGYRGYSFPVTYGTVPPGDAVVFVTPDRGAGALAPRIAGPSVEVIANPVDPFGRLLLVKGRDGGELRTAAASITAAQDMLSGADASLAGVRVPSYEPYGAPRWLPTDAPIRIGDLVAANALEGRGLPPGPLTADFRVAPDLFFWPRDGARLRLDYRYPSATWLDPAASRLDVSLNNNYLETLPLRGQGVLSRWLEGEAAASYTRKGSVQLPDYFLFGQNELAFDYQMMLADKRECVGTLPENVRVSILPTSEIDISGSHHAMRMPDLSAFAAAGYPFTVQPDLADTVAVLPAAPDRAVTQAFLQLAGRFGDSTGATASRIDVAPDGRPELLEGKHVLVVGDLAMASGDLFASAPVQYESQRLRVRKRGALDSARALTDDRDAPADAEAIVQSATGFTGFVSFQSPYGAGRAVVALLGSDTAQLPSLVADLADVEFNADVQGDLSVLDGDGMKSFAVGTRYWTGSLPAWLSAAYWLSGRPIVMVVIALVIAMLVAGPIHLILAGQQKRRLGDQETGDAE